MGIAYLRGMVIPASYERSRARIARLCDPLRDGDPRSLRLHLLEEIRRVLGFDAYVWLLTDPETWVGSAPLADIPPSLLPELPALIRLKYLTAVNRWTTLDSSVGLLHAATRGDPTRSLLWRELLSRHSVIDVASMVLRDRFGCWGFLDLWRTSQAVPFTIDEAAFLASIQAVVTRALRRCQADTFATGPLPEQRRLGPVVLLLTPELDVLGQTPDTHEYLRVLVPPAKEQAPIPASAYNVAAQLLASEAEVDAKPPWARVHLSDGLWLTLRAARVGDRTIPAEQTIAVTIEESSPTERTTLFAAAHGLSSREQELLEHLMTGADTKGVAHRMYLSEHTVQDHLKSIFAKTSVHNRRTLLARALGVGQGGGSS